MAWPSSGDVDTTKFDQDSDKISESRPELEKMAGYINDIIDSGPISNSFSTISANGTSVVADSSSDTLNLVAGNNISITANAGTDTITIASTASGGNPLTANLDTAGYRIFNSTTTDSGLVTVGDGFQVTGTSNFQSATFSSVVSDTVEINAANPSEQIGISMDLDGSTMTGLWVTGTTGDEVLLRVANVAMASSGSRTLDGYIQIIVDGNVRYIPYYL